MFAKILEKRYIGRVWNQVYGIYNSISRTFVVILSQLEARLRRYGRKHLFAYIEIRFSSIFHSIFRTLEVNLRLLNVRMLTYGRIGLYHGFKIRFMAFIVQLLEHWRLFCADWRYGWKIQAKRLFAYITIGFRAFAVLFLEHWKLICVYWRYDCQDMGEYVYILAL